MTPCCPGDATGKSSALWAIANVQTFGDRLNILAGVRKDTSDRLTRNGNVTLENVSYNTSQAGFTFKLFDGNDDGGFLDEAVFSYGYSESVQPNNFFVNSPQEGSGDEFGIRLEAMDGKIAASLSYFDIQLSSIERTDFTDRDPVTGEPRRTLGGSEASDGLEFELYLAPVEGLDIVFNYADYDPRVVSNPSDPQTIGNPTSGAIQGAINSFARYTLQEGPGKGLYFQGTYQQRDDIHPYGSIRNQYLVILPSYDIVAASIGYMMNIRDIYWTFDLTAKNLFDKHYLTKNVNQGEGRRILGSVSVEF